MKTSSPNTVRKTRSFLFLFAGLSLVFACQRVSKEDENTVIYHAETREKSWDGWGLSGPPSEPEENGGREQMTLHESDGHSPRVFSGRVVGRENFDGLEVGLVSLVGVHWVNPEAYQWTPVAPDGTFSLTDANYQDAGKALVVRGPDTPWTFFRFNFDPRQSATDIQIRPEVGKKVTLTISGENMRPQPDLGFEVFPATTQRGDDGQPLRRQRLGQFKSGKKRQVDCVLPLHPVSILIGGKGFSRFYQTIDPREADHFHFVLQRGATMKVVLRNQDGTPRPGVRIRWVNPAAPLSISGGVTNEKGIMVRDGLAPGTFQVNAPGFPPQEVELRAGQETGLNLIAEE